MNALTKARLLARVARWRLTWHLHDADYRAPQLPKNPRFMTAHEAAALLRDSSCVISAGLASNMRCSILYWAVREQFEKTGHPRDLTWIAVGGMGGRGRLPGTVEEVGCDGLVTRFLSGHLETVKSVLALADAGRCELHTLPQGVLARAIEAQAAGQADLLSRVGVGTFVDPRVGTGSLVAGKGPGLVTAEGDQLRYRVPRVDAALFLATAADAEGNLYMDHASALTEAREGARAARANGGRVIASVAELVPKDEARIFLPASAVDAIVVYPWNEQTGAVQQRDWWPMFVPGQEVDVREAREQLAFVNQVMGITPRRGPVDAALARQAAALFARCARPGAWVNVGVGLPEEVCRLVHEGGLLEDVKFMLETGAFGGLPAPGIYFGAAIRPERFLTSAEIFRAMEERLDVTVLGLLQADGEGNVNVSKRGPRALDAVGPGGFIDLSDAAKTVIFVGSWMAGGRLSVEGGRLRILQPGRHKFMTQVDEVTFNGAEALRRGKQVYYATNVGTFRLTARGMELIEVMPGVDVERDILVGCPMPVVLPEHGPVPLIDAAIVTGQGFRLAWPARA